MVRTNVQQLVRLAELEIDPAQLDSFNALLREEIEASIRLEPGVLALCAVAVKDSPALIRVFEVYASREAYEAHLRTPHFLKYKMLTAAMVRSLDLIDAAPIALCFKGAVEGFPG